MTAEVESRDDIKSGRVEELVAARRTLRDVRLESRQRQNITPGYGKGDANDDYLAALQNLITELEPIYERTEILPEFWEPDEGDVLATLERPGLDVSDVLDAEPAYYGTDGYPPIKNPEALEPQTLGSLPSLRELLALQSSRIPFTIELKPVGNRQDTITVNDHMILGRDVLDRARRWTLEFWESVGLSLDIDRQTGPANYSE